MVVADVELVVRELRRITLLWDELWLGSLNQHYGDIQKRLISLNEEAKRLAANQSLTQEQKAKMMSDQQKAVMRPVLSAFQHLAALTAAKAETPHEEKFQRRYGKLIEEALNRLEPIQHQCNQPYAGHPSNNFIELQAGCLIIL